MRILRQDPVYLDFFIELFPFKFSGLWDFDHDGRVDLLNVGDTSFLDPAHASEITPNIHNLHDRDIMREVRGNIGIFRRAVTLLVLIGP